MNFSRIKIDHILKYQLILLVGILVILAGLMTYYLVYSLVYSPSVPLRLRIDKGESVMCRIDGQAVAQGQENLYPVAVNVDNHFESWPNYGLSQASVVYEMLVEGQSTRFLAMYTPYGDEISKIGPVRSTRPYFLPIVKEYDALLAHSGGSVQALQDIEELGINNLEEIAWWGPDYFWRVYSRFEPHNLFTSSQNLAKAVVDWELGDIIPDYQAWQFEKDLDKQDLEQAGKISLDFSLNDWYDVSYEFDSSSQAYLRYQSGDKHLDALNNQQIQVDNLIIQFVPQPKILDYIGRLNIDLVGQGEAIIFRDGVRINGTWKKYNNESRTIFYDANDDEIRFKPGTIWIEIVPKSRQVESW